VPGGVRRGGGSMARREATGAGRHDEQICRPKAAGPLRCYKSADEHTFASFFRYVVEQGLILFVVRGTRRPSHSHSPAPGFSCTCAAPTACPVPISAIKGHPNYSFVMSCPLPCRQAAACSTPSISGASNSAAPRVAPPVPLRPCRAEPALRIRMQIYR
jgi:hypothetical protein